VYINAIRRIYNICEEHESTFDHTNCIRKHRTRILQYNILHYAAHRYTRRRLRLMVLPTKRCANTQQYSYYHRIGIIYSWQVIHPLYCATMSVSCNIYAGCTLLFIPFFIHINKIIFCYFRANTIASRTQYIFYARHNLSSRSSAPYTRRVFRMLRFACAQ